MDEIKNSQALGMVIYFVKDENLTREDVEALWQQGVNMDDWDYMLFCPPEVVFKFETPNEYSEGEYGVKEWPLDKLLNGVCSNQWYRASFRGKEWAIGVAYHS